MTPKIRRPLCWIAEGYAPKTDARIDDLQALLERTLLSTNSAAQHRLSAVSAVVDGSAIVKGAFFGRRYELPFERAFVAFVDDDPLANWGHPCRYVFVKDDLSSFVVWYATEPMVVERDGVAVEMKELLATVELPKKSDMDEVRKLVKSVAAPSKSIDCSNGDTSHSYAVLISGGYNSGNNHTRYWGDTAAMYSTLTSRYGIPKENIVVLMSDGTSPSLDISTHSSSHGYFVGRTSPLDLDGDGVSDVTGPATVAQLQQEFSTLQTKLTADDQLFVFATDHGSQGDDGSAYICLWNSTMMSVPSFAALTENLACPVIFALEFCYSGCFIDTLRDQGGVRVIATAASNETSSAWGLTSKATGIGSNPGLYYMDPWVYYFVGATSGVFPSVSLSPWNDDVSCSGADTSGDGKVSIKEASDYAKARIKADGYSETPMYGESIEGAGASLCLVKGSPSAGTGKMAYLTVSGPAECISGMSAGYTCVACFDDGSRKIVTPTWSVSNGGVGTTITSAGMLSASGITGTCLLTVQATYAEGDVTKTVTKQVVSGARPANDNFDAAIALSGVTGQAVGTNSCATYETGEPLKKFKSWATNTVWWTWTAPATGTVTFETTESNFDTEMGIYTGATLSSLTKVCEDADSGKSYRSICSFACTQGTLYHIAIAGYCGANGEIKLNWLCQETPSPFTEATPGKYGLLVGVGHYALSGCGDLSCCGADVAAMDDVWRQYCDVSETSRRVLRDASATKAQVRAQLAALAAVAKAGDEVLFYQSSHGGNPDTTQKDVCLCMFDAEYWDYELAEDLSRFRSGVRLIVIVDACHSGGLFKSANGTDEEGSSVVDLPARVSALMRKLAAFRVTNAASAVAGISPEEIGWIAAADYDQTSVGYSTGSEFTMAMISAWEDDDEGADSDGDHRLDFHELFKAAENVGSKHNAIGQCANESVLKSVAARIYAGYVPTVVVEPEGEEVVSIPSDWFSSGTIDGVQLFDPELFAERFGTDYASAAMQLTGKVDAQGEPMRVWQDFVAGTDPTDPTSVFSVQIELEDGVPVVKWSPDLNQDGKLSIRTYRTLGLSDLKDAGDAKAWEVVKPGEESQYRFFKVEVDLIK